MRASELRCAAAAALPVLAVLASCQDYTAQKLKPELQLATAVIDFGEVVVGKQSEIGIQVDNVGKADLLIDACDLDGTTSGDFALVPLDTDRVEPGESTVLAAIYTPDMVGQDFGRVRLSTNDPVLPQAEIDLFGFGVEPDIDVDPETLWFGDLPQGEARTLSVRVAAAGTGTTWISAIGFEEATSAFSFALPPEVVLPYGLQAGFSFDIDVTFTPVDDGPVESWLTLQSNDPDEPTAAVRLLGNAEQDPHGNEPPAVEITDPNWGYYLIAGEPTELRGHVTDLEDGPENLTCAWYANTTFLGNSVPDSDGYVSLITAELPIGEIDVLLVALDSQLDTGSDSVQVTVWDPEEPVRYTLSGGATLYDYWTVDDDVEISVDGTTIFADNNHTQDNHPPVEFDASVGSRIHITAWDINECRKKIDALYLHFGTGVFVPLSDAICAASCDSDPCYDPSYAGPWPSVFLDAEYEITIP